MSTSITVSSKASTKAKGVETTGSEVLDAVRNTDPATAASESDLLDLSNQLDQNLEKLALPSTAGVSAQAQLELVTTGFDAVKSLQSVLKQHIANGSADTAAIDNAEAVLQTHSTAVDKIISHLENNPELTAEQKVEAVTNIFGLSFGEDATVDEKQTAFEQAQKEFKVAFEATKNPEAAKFVKSQSIVEQARALITESGWGEGAKMSDAKVIETLYTRSASSSSDADAVNTLRSALRSTLELESDASASVVSSTFEGQKSLGRRALEPVVRYVNTHRKSTAVAALVAGLALYYKGDDLWESLFGESQESPDNGYGTGPSQQPDTIQFGNKEYEIPRPADGGPWKMQNNLEKIETGRYRITWSQSDGSSRSDVIHASMENGELKVSIERGGSLMPLQALN